MLILCESNNNVTLKFLQMKTLLKKSYTQMNFIPVHINNNSPSNTFFSINPILQ
jgi:hypothetical protein